MDTPTKIRLLRTAENLRQVDLSELSGIAVRDISAIESGQVGRWEQRLLEALGYTPELDGILRQLAGGALPVEAGHGSL